MFTRRTIPFIIGSILLVAVAFLFLSRALNWTYVSDFYKDEPEIIIAPDTEPVEIVELDVGVMLPEDQYNELLMLSQQVSERYPDIIVNISNYYEEQLTFEEWERLAKLGSLGDIQLVNNEWVVPLAIQGLFQPVDRLMNNDVLSDQLPSVTDALKWNGYMWAVPYETNPYILFVHKDAYDEEESEIDDLQIITSPPTVLDDSLALKDVAVTSASKDSDRQEKGEEQAVDWSFNHWLTIYEKTVDFEGPFISLDMEQVSSLLIWMSLWNNSTDEPMQLGKLDEQQYAALKYLQENSDLVHMNQSLDESQLPLLLLRTVKQYYEQRAFIDANYVSKRAFSPLPWINGKSFMMSANTVEAEAAMRWLETMNRFQPKDTLIHRQTYAKYSSDSIQILLREKMLQKLLISQLFSLDLDWVKRYEQLDQRWINTPTLSEKLELLINEYERQASTME